MPTAHITAYLDKVLFDRYTKHKKEINQTVRKYFLDIVNKNEFKGFTCSECGLHVCTEENSIPNEASSLVEDAK